ncbi:MAG: pyruvate:ferredoxin (flavodoxin) oxidoreductase [Deltaproteobacteria bacterium]|nr:pyruvate:ferredoxin (flavodoxin) oxidoreductase [Deltaproteobacteria bacterium]
MATIVKVLDANEAVASVAYRLSEVVAIYPITPASAMGEHSDAWAAARRPNLWGGVPDVIELQSEGGAAGALHGALQAGALATSFTASQGLLLMVPNLLKIAGELTPFVLHVAARTLATHALSIFGDHSDVMLARTTGVALLCAGSPQEAADFAAVAHVASLESRVPFIHFFDGFRTSHELQKIGVLGDDDLRALVSAEAIAAHRARALTPDRPVMRGTAQNPDVFFQAREACNPHYEALPAIVEDAFARIAARTGRAYRLFDYVGHPEAERVIVMMGSGAECAHETVDHLVARGERVGLVKVRLFRPFSAERLLAALPASVRSIAVLDRTKEPGATGEPLHLDVVMALSEAAADGRRAAMPRVIGGRYGLGMKELTPGMIAAVFGELASAAPRKRFTLGIVDDVTRLSLPWSELDLTPPDVTTALFYGLGSDGTVSSNKQSLVIIGEETPLHVQGHFVYDSKKSGSTTVSHLRFGPRPFRSTYEIQQARFVAIHDPGALTKLDPLARAAPGATVVINTAAPPERAFVSLPPTVRRHLVDKGCRLFVIDAAGVAERAGLGRRINTVMQVVFFGISKVLPADEAIARIKDSIAKAWGKRGDEVVRRNVAAVDEALAHLHEVVVPPQHAVVEVVQRVRPRRGGGLVEALIAGRGDLLPVSAFPIDGTFPTGTAKLEKRAIAADIPIWDPAICVQCNRCALVCPHAAIRVKAFPEAALPADATALRHVPETYTESLAGLRYTVQVAPDDCTGCGLCVAICPAKDKRNPRHKAIDMSPYEVHAERERAAWDVFTTLPETPHDALVEDPKHVALREPYFEFSGACAGCGETPYLTTLTRLFGDRLLIANATGCSSIYGGNLPTTPWTTDARGRGPAWANSLFEDNAEFGLGMRVGADALARRALDLVLRLAPELGDTLVVALTAPEVLGDEAFIAARREAVAALRTRLAGRTDAIAKELLALADWLVPKSLWLVGGDGWAYDIGYGGLDHVLASNRKVNVLVLDTEVYSNTGGQQSKATPLGAVAKFAAAGKETRKKDLGLLAISYGHVYVAEVAFHAKYPQTIRALLEAERHPGPAIVIAHSPCIAHGYDLVHAPEQQKLAVQTGVWPLYHWDPKRIEDGQPPLVLDAPEPTKSVRKYMENEARFRMVELKDPERYERLVGMADAAVRERWSLYRQLAQIRLDAATKEKTHG